LAFSSVSAATSIVMTVPSQMSAGADRLRGTSTRGLTTTRGELPICEK
jgi:hypothetical protein